jgi:hypothetical protein
VNFAAIRVGCFVLMSLTASLACAAEITLYDQEGYGGRRFSTHAPFANLGDAGFNHVAASVVIKSGTWQLCENPEFHGRCVTLTPGEYPSLEPYSLTRRVASVREFVAQAAPPPPATPRPSAVRITLYDGFDFTGRSITLDQTEVNLDLIGFNDRARSAIVYGADWELCLHEQFRGTCQIYAPGRHPSLGAGLDGEVSSARPLAAPPPPPPPAQPRGPFAILYDQPSFAGNTYEIDGPELVNLANTGFNDRAMSLRVLRGQWIFCVDAQYQGACLTFDQGDYPYLPIELDRKISSGRRVDANRR